MNIQEFRQQYPQYDHVDDTTLSKKLHEKSYSHVPYETFAKKFEVTTPAPMEEETKPTFWEKHPTGAQALKLGIEIPAMAIGGIGGAIAGAPTVVGAPATAAIGAGLGYGAAKAAERAIGLERPIKTVKEAITTPIKEVAEGALMEVGGVATGKILGKVGTKVKDVFSPQAVKLQKQLSKTIEEKFFKAIQPSPSSVGKTFAQKEVYSKKIVDATKNVIENKSNLTLFSPDKGSAVGVLPESVEQFSQAIEQTMKNTFTKYDTIAKAAGQKGAMVNVSPIVKELNEIATDSVINIKSPSTALYAKSMARRFADKQQLSPSEAQDLIAIFNSDLNAFYKNPSLSSAGKARTDALAVNNLRKLLDETIEQLEGTGYQQLKRDYGALKALQGDVQKRTNALANKNAQGLIHDLADTWAGHQAIRSILTGDPVTLASSATVKGLSMWQKYIRNPNRMIKGMFKNAEILLEKSKTFPREGVKKVLEPSSAIYHPTPQKALMPPKPEIWRSGEGFAMREATPPLYYPPHAGVIVEPWRK